MATILPNFGTGGANLTPTRASGTPSLAEALRDIADDLTALRASVVAITAKLDADAAVGNGAGTYAATCDPAALKTIKG